VFGRYRAVQPASRAAHLHAGPSPRVAARELLLRGLPELRSDELRELAQSAAQRFYEQNGGPSQDPHWLDGDGDRLACEELP
jgi:hypothetical protein